MKKYFIISCCVIILSAYAIVNASWDEPARANSWMVASGHELATKAGRTILRNGGNAFDAGVATCMALNVTRPISAGMVGVSPTLIYDANTGKVRSYCGLGVAPAKATPEYYRQRGWIVMPFYGIKSQLIPASPDTWIAILKEYGTKSFGELAREAIRLAEEGHPLNKTVAHIIDLPAFLLIPYKRAWPYGYSIFFEPFQPDGPKPGDILVQKDLAKSLKLMVAAEKAELARSGDRIKALEAVRDVFYKGEIAEAIVKLQEERGGIIAREDLANYRGRWEEPVKGSYKGYDIWANDTWCQGPTVPMILQILEGVDLKSMGLNSPEYISTVAQAIELAFSDREAYFGDPDFVDVPIRGLLSKKHAAERRKLIDPNRAFGRMPPPGDPWKFEGRPRPKRIYKPKPQPASILPSKWHRDTTYLCVADSQGNALSLTPSDFPVSPMVPGYGILLGIRMTQFHLKKGHPARVAPGKRPRLTPNPSMVTKDGKLFMAFGTPGGDMQPQAMVQVFLNIVEWGMDPQAAINASRFKTKNFPDSFSPHLYFPGRLELEEAIADRMKALKKQGYKVKINPSSLDKFGAVCAIIRNESGHLIGGADPREESLALGD